MKPRDPHTARMDTNGAGQTDWHTDHHKTRARRAGVSLTIAAVVVIGGLIALF